MSGTVAFVRYNATPAPFPSGTLQPPLTQAQKTTLANYDLKRVTELDVNKKPISDPGLTVANIIATYNILGDSTVISNYEQEIRVPDGTIIPQGTKPPISTFPGGAPIPSQVEGPLKTFASWGEAITGLINNLVNPAFWRRVSEVLLGLILLGMGLATLSRGTGDALRKIPLYGKAIPA